MSNFLIFFTTIFLLFSCSSNTSTTKLSSNPSWYNNPKQNNNQSLYGLGQGRTLEEATKLALADAAARLMVSVSSESNLLREENRNDFNEETRQSVKQNIEKITFTNFEVTNSAQTVQDFFVEVMIDRNSFINQQQEDLQLAEKKISDLDKNSDKKNPLSRRNALIKISDLGKEVELKSRILQGAGQNVNVKEKLNYIQKFNNELQKFSDKIEFFIEEKNNSEIAKIIRTQINKEKIKVSSSYESSNSNQVLVKISSTSDNNKIYDFTSKLKINFENIISEKIVASNIVEVTGHSVISEKAAQQAALKELEEKISKDGILKTIGIIN